MNHTQTYKLSQWEKTDRILMSDFNADNAKIETALSALVGTQTAESARLDAAVAAAEAKIAPAIENRLKVKTLAEYTATASNNYELPIAINGLPLGQSLFFIAEVTAHDKETVYLDIPGGGGSFMAHAEAWGKCRILFLPLRDPDAVVFGVNLAISGQSGMATRAYRALNQLNLRAYDKSKTLNGTYRLTFKGIL